MPEERQNRKDPPDNPHGSGVMNGCIFMTPGDALYGFAMAGFRQLVTDRESVLAELEKVVRAGSAGLVFIDERLLSEGVTARVRVIEQQWRGAVVILPAPGPAIEPGSRDFGMRLIARVLGYHVKLS